MIQGMSNGTADQIPPPQPDPGAMQFNLDNADVRLLVAPVLNEC